MDLKSNAISTAWSTPFRAALSRLNSDALGTQLPVFAGDVWGSSLRVIVRLVARWRRLAPERSAIERVRLRFQLGMLSCVFQTRDFTDAYQVEVVP